jgi:hypothetical protein
MTHPRPLVGARVLFLLLLALSAGASHGGGAAVRESTDKLNVHIVCHSHDDAGWLKTVDQYYYGANNTIQVQQGWVGASARAGGPAGRRS